MTITSDTHDLAPTAMPATSARERYASLALFALFMLSAIGLKPPVLGGSSADWLTGDGDIMRQLSYLLVFGFAVYALRVLPNPARALAIPFPMLVLFGWCLLSLTWAIEPSIALRRLGLTTIIGLTVFATVRAMTVETTQRTMRLALLLILIGGFVAVAIFPAAKHGYDGEWTNLAGNWRGLQLHKNVAGATCAFTILFFFFAERGMRWTLRWGVILASAYFLYETQSKTSLALAAVAIVVGWTYARCTVPMRRWLMALVVLALLFMIVLVDTISAEVTAVFAQPDALTGRGAIWPYLVDYAATNPIFGAGFGSFWNIGDKTPINGLSRDWIASLGTGHNGYLDLLVTIGAPGLILAVTATIIAPFLTLLGSPRVPARTAGLLVGMLCFCTGQNFTESTMLERDMMVGILQIMAIAMVAQARRESIHRGSSAGLGRP